MGDFYLDDAFFDHPKALHAGEDAANLYVRGLAWAHRHNTGHIPKNAVPTFTTRRNPEALVAKLCEVTRGFDNPLWIDRGDSYEIHDWYVRNAKATARRNAGKKGAEAKWRKFHEQQLCDRIESASAIAAESHKQEPGLPLPNQPRNQGTKEPRTGGNALQQQQACSGSDAAALQEAALNLLVDRRILAAELKGKTVDNPGGYRYVVLPELRIQHAVALADPPDDVDLTSAEKWANWLEPSGLAPLAKPNGAFVYVAVPDCPTCSNLRWLEADGDTYARCPACSPVAA